MSLPDSWPSKNYAFEIVEAINIVAVRNILTELGAASFHALIIHEGTDIKVHKMLIINFKFHPVKSLFYKTVLGGMAQLTACDASSLWATITQYSTEHHRVSSTKTCYIQQIMSQLSINTITSNFR